MLFHRNSYNENTINNNPKINYLTKICREMKSTVFPSSRYIIPRDWFDNIINNNNIILLNNSQFLNEDKTTLNDFIDERNIVLIIYEIMNFIHSTFLYDFIIEVEIYENNNDIAFIKDVKVMGNNEFIEPENGYRNSNNAIKNSYMKYPQFQFAFNNDFQFKEKQSEIISKSDNESVSIISNSKYIYNSTTNKFFDLNIFGKKYIEPIGIKNKSIYCYMISCLQVLISIPELNYFFLYKKYKKQDQKTLICDDFSDFISLYKYFQKTNQTCIELPSSIYNICHSILQKDVMNDSEEFLILFLKSIQEELKTKIENENNINNKENKLDIEKLWINYRNNNNSFIDGLFTGFIRSTVICNSCKNETYNFEPFMDLSVPIPKKNKSIVQCLNEYFNYENLDCNYHCEKCKLITSVSLINI